jgi:hypothetical protein
MCLVITEPQGGEFFSVAIRFRLIHVPEVWILGTPDSEDCKSFPVNTVLRYKQVPFKTGLTVIWQFRTWVFLYKWFKRLNRILVFIIILSLLATIIHNFYCCVCPTTSVATVTTSSTKITQQSPTLPTQSTHNKTGNALYVCDIEARSCNHFCCGKAMIITYSGQSQWPRGLRRGSAAARCLGLWVRIAPGKWMPVSCECCMLSGRGLRIRLNTRPKFSTKECGVPECDLEASTMRKSWPTKGCWLSHSARKEYAPYNIAICGLSWCTTFFHAIL